MNMHDLTVRKLLATAYIPLPHRVAFSTLLLGSLALLSTGGAHAASSTSMPCTGSIDTPNAIPGTGTFVAANLSLPTAPGITGTCDILSSMPNYVTVDIDFNPVIMNSSGVFTYSLSVSNPGWWFTMARVDSDVNIQGTTPTTWRKEVFSDSGFVNKIWDFTSVDGSAITQPLPGTYSTVWVRDTYNVPADAVFDVGTNTFYQTPGPLPVLGACTALGISRRLRKRIKASRSS